MLHLVCVLSTCWTLIDIYLKKGNILRFNRWWWTHAWQSQNNLYLSIKFRKLCEAQKTWVVRPKYGFLARMICWTINPMVWAMSQWNDVRSLWIFGAEYFISKIHVVYEIIVHTCESLAIRSFIRKQSISRIRTCCQKLKL